MKRYTKFLILFGIVMLVILTAYISAWLGVYNFGKRYMKFAMKMESQGNLIKALEGYEEYDYGKNKYVDYAGYVRISVMFDTSTSFPKPKIASIAKKKVFKILSSLSTDKLESYFRMVMRKEHPYRYHILAELINRFKRKGNLQKEEFYIKIFEKLGGKKEDIDKYYTQIHSDVVSM